MEVRIVFRSATQRTGEPTGSKGSYLDFLFTILSSEACASAGISAAARTGHPWTDIGFALVWLAAAGAVFYPAMSSSSNPSNPKSPVRPNQNKNIPV